MKTAQKRSDYQYEYGKKWREDHKPRTLTIYENGYKLELIEIKKADRHGTLYGQEVQYPQPRFKNIPDMALRSIKKLYVITAP